MRLKENTEGMYESSYFFMKLETNDSLSENLDKHEKTFIHEYIHFIQDIFLPYNIRQNLVELRKFQIVASKASNEGITLPFSEWDEEIFITKDQFEYTWGSDKFIKEDVCEINIVEINHEYFTVKETPIRIFKYTATLTSGEEYQIGARDMLEYISHKIEEQHWQTENQSPTYPYQTIDKIFSHYKLDMVPTVCRIALVEFCLHNDNPIHLLLNMIKGLIQKNDENFLLDYELTKKYLVNYQWNSAGGFEETIHTKLQRRIEDIKGYLYYIYNEATFKDITLWLKDVLIFISNELKGRLFFSELYKNTDDFFNKIDDIIEQIGIPLIFNAKFECISLIPEKYDQNQFIQFYIASRFIGFIEREHKTCPIYDFCENTNPDIMSGDCIDNAILKGRDEKLCPFGQFIKTYQLHKIS